MSSAHRPTWEPAKAKSDLSHMSQAFSKHSLPAHTKLKFRRPGDTQKRSLDEMKAELTAGEKRAYAERHPGQEFESESKEEEPKRIKSSADATEDAETPAIAPSGVDEDDDAISDEDDEDDDDEEDADALMRELEKIKQERREEQERRQQAESAKEQLSREEEIARGNPLLNLEQALHGDAKPQTSSLPPQQRWDDDLIFRNQAAHADNGLSQRGFVNDLTRTYDFTHFAGTEFHKKFMSVCICLYSHAAIYQVGPPFCSIASFPLSWPSDDVSPTWCGDVDSHPRRHGALCCPGDRCVQENSLQGLRGQENLHSAHRWLHMHTV